MRFQELAFASLVVAAVSFSFYTIANQMSTERGVAPPIPISAQVNYRQIEQAEGNQTQSAWDSMAGAIDRLILNIPVAGEVYSGVKTIGGYMGVMRRAFDTSAYLFSELTNQVTLTLGVPSYIINLGTLAIGILVTWSLYAALMNRSG